MVRGRYFTTLETPKCKGATDGYCILLVDVAIRTIHVLNVYLKKKYRNCATPAEPVRAFQEYNISCYVWKTFCHAIGCRVTSGCERWWLMFFYWLRKNNIPWKYNIKANLTNHLTRGRDASEPSKIPRDICENSRCQHEIRCSVDGRCLPDAGLHANITWELTFLAFCTGDDPKESHHLRESPVWCIRWCSFWNQSREIISFQFVRWTSRSLRHRLHLCCYIGASEELQKTISACPRGVKLCGPGGPVWCFEPRNQPLIFPRLGRWFGRGSFLTVRSFEFLSSEAGEKDIQLNRKPKKRGNYWNSKNMPWGGISDEDLFFST